jgi:hypothetical protein
MQPTKDEIKACEAYLSKLEKFDEKLEELDEKISEDIRLKSQNAENLLLRPGEVSSRIAHPTILEVGNNPLRSSVEHRHMLVGRIA